MLGFVKFVNRGAKTDGSTVESRDPLTESAAMGQFAVLQAVMPGVGKIPAELRDAIKWAENQKAKFGMD